MEFKTVQIIPVPGTATTIGIAANASLKDILAEYTKQTGKKVEMYDVRINGSDAAMTVIPADNSKIYLVEKVKGRA